MGNCKSLFCITLITIIILYICIYNRLGIDVRALPILATEGDPAKLKDKVMCCIYTICDIMNGN